MAVATPPSASQELRADTTSASTNGRPIPIALDYTIVGDVTTLHAMTQADVVDKVFLTLWNVTDASVEIQLIISPNDDTVIADVDAATLSILVPPKRPLELPPFFVRYDSGNSYTMAAYSATADVDSVLVTSRYVRLTQGDLTS